MKKWEEKVLKFFEISSKLKRVGAFALAFLLSFLAIAPSLKAVSGSSEWIPGFYYKASGGTYGQMTRLYIGGEDVFCLEPGKVFIDGEYSQGNVLSVLSESNLKKIEFIIYIQLKWAIENSIAHLCFYLYNKYSNINLKVFSMPSICVLS